MFVEAVVLNIASHELHGQPDRYVQLFRAMYSRFKSAPFNGDRRALITSCPLKGQSLIWQGTIASFLHVDLKKPWLDLDAMDFADESKIAEQVRLPEGLKPNAREFRYYFDAGEHLLAVQTRGPGEGRKASAGSFLRMFRFLASEVTKETDEYGVVSVSVIQDKSAVAELLALTDLRRITVEINAPNPDQSDFEKAIAERMDRLNAKKLVESISASRGEDLKPDKELKMLATVASKNGRVIVVSEAAPKQLSSEQSPKVEKTGFRASDSSEDIAFEAIARKLTAKDEKLIA